MAVEHVSKAVWRVQQDLFEQLPVREQCDAAELMSGVDGQDHWVSCMILSMLYTLPFAFIPTSRSCSTAGKRRGVSGEIFRTPLGPVPRTRYPWPPVATSPVHNHIIERVARLSRFSFAPYGVGFDIETVSVAGSAISNGTFCELCSTSCSAVVRASNR